MNQLTSPTPDEYASYYAGYIERAQAKGDVLAALSHQVDEIQIALGKLLDEQALFRDAPKEWSIKEVIGHLNDVERVFSYRLLRISRNDPAPLAGFEQDDYVRSGNFQSRTLASLIEEFRLARASTLALLRGLDGATLTRRGVADGKAVSARALAYIIAGHERHHVGILQERYHLSA